jgi:hypothetical protein
MTYEEYQVLGALAGWPVCTVCKRRYEGYTPQDNSAIPWLHKCPVPGCDRRTEHGWLESFRYWTSAAAKERKTGDPF